MQKFNAARASKVVFQQAAREPLKNYLTRSGRGDVYAGFEWYLSKLNSVYSTSFDQPYTDGILRKKYLLIVITGLRHLTFTARSTRQAHFPTASTLSPMSSAIATANFLPDIIQSQPAQLNSCLDWVGMQGIAMPIQIADRTGQEFHDNAQLGIYVNLIDPTAKGIHMSRLYLIAEEFCTRHTISPHNLQQLLTQALHSHKNISDSAQVTINATLLIKRSALKSTHAGWKAYPVHIRASQFANGAECELTLSIPYSSSCPCSAALARQLIQQAFSAAFSSAESIDKNQAEQWLLDHATLAIPHSQRSYANLWVQLKPSCQELPIIELIDACEAALHTPVQTAVKREDEQEFARLNGQHPQFCEDAARQLKSQLNKLDYITDFHLKVDHQESLHPHNAVAFASKGLPQGYRSGMFSLAF